VVTNHRPPGQAVADRKRHIFRVRDVTSPDDGVMQARLTPSAERWRGYMSATSSEIAGTANSSPAHVGVAELIQ